MATGRLDVFFGSMFSGKCFKRGTNVLMYDGSTKRVENLVNGDSLMGDDSKARIVSNFHNGFRRLYTVRALESFYGGTFADDYTVTGNHILSLILASPIDEIGEDFDEKYTFYVYVQDHRIRYKLFPWAKFINRGEATLTAQEYAKIVRKNSAGDLLQINVKKFMSAGKEWQKMYMGYQVPVDFPEQPVTSDPYIIGDLIGDGKLDDIPQEYITNSAEVRIALLKGIIKRTGYSDGTHTVIELDDRRLVDAVLFIARSLGCRASYVIDLEQPLYCVYVNANFNVPFVGFHKKFNQPFGIQVCQLEVFEINKSEFFGFAVDGNHRFLLADCTVVHNSSAVLRKLSQYGELNKKTLYINHAMDTRSDKAFSTHSKITNQYPNVEMVKTGNLRNLSEEYLCNFDIIGIDEAQFFDEYLIEFVKNLVDKHKKYLIVVGLDGDFNRKKFGYILDLVPLADKVTKLHAYCKRCAERGPIVTALFSHIIKKPDNPETNEIIGAADEYIPVCRSCYLDLQN